MILQPMKATSNFSHGKSRHSDHRDLYKDGSHERMHHSQADDKERKTITCLFAHDNLRTKFVKESTMTNANRGCKYTKQHDMKVGQGMTVPCKTQSLNSSLCRQFKWLTPASNAFSTSQSHFICSAFPAPGSNTNKEVHCALNCCCSEQSLICIKQYAKTDVCI